MLKSIRFVFTFALVLSFSFSSGLFFSEYAEGSSNHKYLEIYNSTDSDVMLSEYAFILVMQQYPWMNMNFGL